MKVFIIPSWYPSKSNPIYGIFNKEQARLMAKSRPNWTIGVSRWGQGDEPFLLKAREVRSIAKALKKFETEETQLSNNLKEYFTGAFTWTRKWRKGNLNGIVNANERNLQRFISDFGKPDLISAQASYPAALVASALSSRYGIPFTVTLRMSPFPFPQYLTSTSNLKSIIRKPLCKASALVATSEYLKVRTESFGFSNVHTINNPVDTSFFSPTASRSDDELTILSIGRIEEQKGFDLLIEAIERVPGPKLRIAGKGSLMNEHKQLAKNLQVENRISWLGELSREEVLREMQACSFYVLSSRHETFGNVVVEALACGKPVVATQCGGPEELIDEETGYLCEVEVNDLAMHIQKMIDNLHMFDSEKIRNLTKMRYGPDVWIQKVEEIFKSVVKV